MKAILIFCLLTITAIHTRTTTRRFEDKGGRFMKTGKTASKLIPVPRQFGESDSGAATQCAATCEQQSLDRMRTELPENTDLFEEGVVLSYDTATLTALCSINDQEKTCLEQCSSSSTKMTALRSNGIIHKACHETSLKQNAPCLREVYNTTYENRCGLPTKCARHQTQSMQATRDDNRSEAMKQECLYWKCNLECLKPKIIEKCGQGAQTDLESIVENSFETMKTAVENGRGEWPEECDEIVE